MISPKVYSDETYKRFENQVFIAQVRICHDLGFDAWSVQLSDTQQAYGFLVPEEIYKKYEISNDIERYIIDIFTTYYIDVKIARWRKSSDTPYEHGNTYVDYRLNLHDSQRCNLELKHHLLLVLAPGYWAPGHHEVNHRSGACLPPSLPYKWHKEENNDPPHYVRQWAATDKV